MLLILQICLLEFKF